MRAAGNTRIYSALVVVGLLALLGCGDEDSPAPAENNAAANNSANNAANNAPNNSANNSANNAAPLACEANATCVGALGAGASCGEDGVCASAITAECPNAYGAWGAEDRVILGSILPTTGDFASIGVPIEQAVRMAVDEFNANGGIGGGGQLAYLSCNSAGNSEQGQRAAMQLASVGAPAIIGPAFSGIYLDVVTLVTRPAGVMVMSPSATSPAITGLDDGGLAWRTVPSDAFQGVAMAARIRDLSDAEGRPLKVLAFGKDDAYGQGLLNAVTNELAGELGDDFFGTIYDNPGEVENPNIPDRVVQALAEIPQPDVVLLLGTNEVVQVLAQVEAQVRSGALTRPRYILSDGGKLPETIAAVQADPTLAAALEITAPASENGSVFSGYNDRFNALYGQNAGVYTANAYDAAYLLGLGLCKVRGDGTPPSGGRLATAMSNLVTGAPTPARPSTISDACTALASGGSVDFDGASGPLNFDLTTGEAPGDASLFDVWERRPGEFEFRTLGRYGSSDGAWSYE